MRSAPMELLDAQRLAAILHTLPGAVVVEDATRHVVLANEAFGRLFSDAITPQHLVGLSCTDAVQQCAPLFADPERFLARVTAILDAGTPVAGEVLALADGRFLERDFVPTVVDGQRVGNVWLYRDVTERERAAAQAQQQRRFFEQVLDAMPAQLAVFDPDTRYRYVTPSAIADPEMRRHLIGHTDEEYARLRGLPPDVPRRRVETVQRVVETGQMHTFEESFHTRDGALRHFVRFVSPVFDEAGAVSQVLGYGLDLTERKRAEEAAREADQRLNEILHSLDEVVWSMDPRTQAVDFYNPATLRALGLDTAPADIDAAWDAAIHLDDRARAADAFERMWETGSLDLDYRIVRPDGAVRWLHDRGYLVRDDTGEVVRLVGVATDITERKHADDARAASEALNRGMITAALDAVITMDAEGRILEFNPAAERIFGHAADAVRGRMLADTIIPERFRAAHARGLALYLSTGEGPVLNRLIELPALHAAGHEFPTEISITPVRLGEAHEVFTAFVRDITARKQAEAALAASEARYKQIVEDSRDLIYRADADGRFTYVNPVAARVMGYAEASLIGRRYVDLVAPEARAEVEAFYLQQVHTQTPNTYLEFPTVTATGATLWLGQNVQLLLAGPAEAPTVQGVQALARDVTERRQTMEALVLARDTAERAVRAREEFLANMSHEMRTPLNAVIGMSALLRRTALDAEQQEYLSALSFSADTLLALINDLLDIAKIESGQIRFERVPFRLAETVRGAFNTLGFRAREKGLEMTLTLADDLPPVLIGDPVRLGQILLNLVSNAVKFTEQGHVALDVRLSPASGADTLARVCFTVTDSGIGIPEAQRARVFERFTQARADTTRRYGGSGLGLAIVRELTERQGGTVTVESEEGRGSTFSVVLAFEVGTALQALPEDDDADLTGAHVLVVDDNAINLVVARRLLESWGARVDVAPDGRVAVEQVQQAHAAGDAFGLVFMDVQMPEMDGYEATARLRALFSSDVLPIVALTASSLVEHRSRMEHVGMDDLVLKPFNPAHLRRTAAHHLGRLTHASEGPPLDTTPPLFQPDVLLERVGGDRAFARQLAEMFVDEAPVLQQRLRAAHAENNLDALAAAAHRYRSPAGVLGMGRLYALLGTLEAAARAASDACDALVEASEELTAAALDAVGEYLSAPPTSP